MNTNTCCNISTDEHRVIEEVARHYSLLPETLFIRSRKRKICEARQVAMYLIRKTTMLSNNQVARLFNGFDHSTVCHSKKLIETLYETDKNIRQRVDAIVEGLRA